MGNIGENFDMDSLAGSDDELWESLKNDLTQNRVAHDAKLQNLKGRFVKIQCRQMEGPGVQKRAMKKHKWKIALKKALIKILSRRSGRQSKVAANQNNCKMNGCTSTMTFQVTEVSEAASICRTSLPESHLSVSSLNNDCHSPVQDQSVQTGAAAVGDNFSQTNGLDSPHGPMTPRWAWTSLQDNLHLPVILSPSPCTMCFMCTCNQTNGSKLDLQSLLRKNQQQQEAQRALADRGIQTDENESAVGSASPGTTHDELFVCSSSNVQETVTTQSTLDSIPPVPSRISLSQTGDDVVVELKKLSAALSSLKCDLRQQNIELARSLNTFPTASVHAPLSSKTLCASEGTSPATEAAEVLSGNVSHNKAGLNSAVATSKISISTVNFNERETAESNEIFNPEVLVKEVSQAVNSAQMGSSEKQQKVDSNVEPEQQQEEKTAEILKTDQNRQQDLITTSVQDAKANSETGGKSPAFVNRGLKRNLKTESKAAEKSPSESGSQVLLASDAGKEEKDVAVTKKIAINGPKVELNVETSKSSSKKVHDDCAMRQKGDSSLVSVEEIKNSPSFEEINPSELESLLLVWRQQEEMDAEQVTKDQDGSSNFLFKKSKRMRDLPSELQNVRILKPPPLLKDSSKPSALQILEEEMKKPPLIEDDDVPEFSQITHIQQPKKRRLKLKQCEASPPLPVVFQRSKTALSNERNSSSGVIIKEVNPKSKEKHLDAGQNSEASLPLNQRREPKKGEGKEGVNQVRSSKRLKAAASLKKNNEATQEMQPELAKNDSKSDSCEKSPALKNYKRAKVNLFSDKNANKTELKESVSHESESASRNEDDGKKPEYTDQIQDRVNKLKQKWLLERFVDTNRDADISDLTASTICTPPPSPPNSEASSSCITILLPADQMKMLKDIPFHEFAKAHDLAVNVLLNPWRGFTAKSAVRGFVCPEYDSKVIGRALWDLRSHVAPEEIIEKVVSVGWKDFHPVAVRALVSMFVLCLSREVSFVIEAASSGEDDDTCSISSEADLKSRRKTPIRFMASKSIFKGERVDGLRGLLLNMTCKSKYRSWIFPKFKESHDLALLGPLAYLKRKESVYNTEAVLLGDKVIAAKAIRHIQCGERLFVSFKKIEHLLLQ